MSFYGNLLRAANDRLGYIADDPDRCDNSVDWKLSFAAKPKKNIDLSMEKKVECVHVDATTCKQVEKTNSKLKHGHGDCTTTMTFANDKMVFEGKGKAVDEDGWKVDITGAGEVKQAKKEWKMTGKLDIATPDMGGAKANINIHADYNNKQEVVVKPAVNLEISDEFNLGVNAKWDTKTFQEVWPQMVYKPADNKDAFYWGRADMTRSLFRAGCDQKLREGINHSFEFVYGWKDFVGIMGKPVAILSGVNYQLSDKTELAASVNWQGDYDVESEVTHEVDEHWTVSAKQTFCSEKAAYHVGFSAAYKL